VLPFSRHNEWRLDLHARPSLLSDWEPGCKHNIRQMGQQINYLETYIKGHGA
jgi:hypothetical protein